MIPEQLIQRTKDWYQYKCGKMSASRVFDLMATTQTGKPTADRARLLKQLVSERLTGVPVIKRVPSLDARADMEDDAIAAYEFYYSVTVSKVGCVPHPFLPNACSSPDGLVGDDGVLEIKCLDSAQHAELCETKLVPKEYEYQMQFQLACTQRSWADFAAFDPRMPEELKLYTVRYPRDDHAIERIESAVKEFDIEIENKIAAIRGGVRAV